MRRLIAGLVVFLLGAAALPAVPEAGKSPYKIDFDPDSVEMLDRDAEGKDGVFVRVKFAITLDGNRAGPVGDEYTIAIYENGKKVAERRLPRPTASTDLSVILALDTSGSMKEHNRMPMARQAAETFLAALPPPADCGLVLFDHEIRRSLRPSLDRKPILAEIRAIQPRGGTAYRDAALASVQMLAPTPKGKDRAVVLMTDGADVNSTHSLEALIAEAKRLRVRIFTIGIGEPGKSAPVNTALVLDRSGSMELPADNTDLKTPKIKALHEAATAFVHMMSPSGKASLIPFSSTVEPPRAFTGDKAALKRHIAALTAGGETAVFDAVYTGIAALEADGAPGKRAVVAMTDGIDNSSRRRVEEVIARAKEAKIKLYLLGFGRPNEIDHTVMDRMATETGGKYYHAANKAALMKIFENLSIELHDDGIDEESLKLIAEQTGGSYHAAKDVSKLQFVLEQVSKSIPREAYEIVFPSINQRKDGSKRNIALRLVRAGSTDPGELVGTGGYQTHGLIVAEMHPLIYLVLLAVLGGLIALPAFLRRPSAA